MTHPRIQIGMFRPIRVDHTNCLQVAIKTHFIHIERLENDASNLERLENDASNLERLENDASNLERLENDAHPSLERLENDASKSRET